MRLRLVLWGLLLMLQIFAIAFPLEAIAPFVAGAIYVPLTVLRAFGLPVFAGAESGGWPAPSLLGWVVVAFFWAALWWAAVVLVSSLVERRIKNV